MAVPIILGVMRGAVRGVVRGRPRATPEANAARWSLAQAERGLGVDGTSVDPRASDAPAAIQGGGWDASTRMSTVGVPGRWPTTLTPDGESAGWPRLGPARVTGSRKVGTPKGKGAG